MCALNKLKKKLHFKKLIDFLYLYKNVLFYHSNNNKKNTLPLPLDSYSVLFLINFARVRKVTKSENLDYLCTNAQSLVFSKNTGYGSQSDRNHYEMMNTWSDSRSKQEKLCLLRQLTLAEARGSTLLIGCASLESMQNNILTFSAVCSQKKLQTQNNCDYACIGAIYDNGFIDNRDCLRLAQINTQTENLHLIRTLSNPGKVVVEKLLIPTLLMSLYLQMRCK